MLTPKKVSVLEEPEGPVFIYRWQDWGFSIMVFAGLCFVGMGIWSLSLIGIDAPWIATLMLSVIVLFGLGLLYWSLGRVINRSEIRLQGGVLSVRHKPLPWRGQAELPISDIRAISLETYSDYIEGSGGAEGYGNAFQGEIRFESLVAFVSSSLGADKAVILIPKVDPPAYKFLEQQIEARLGLGQALSPVELEMAVQYAGQVEKQRDVSEGKGAVMIMAVLFLGLAILGIGLLVSTYLGQGEQRLSMAWPAVEGQVVDGWVERHAEDNDDSPGVDRVYYVPIVTYAYVFSGKEYTSDRFRVVRWTETSFDTEQEAIEFMQNYPLGKKLVVYVNPDRPQYAVIERLPPGDASLMYIFGWALVTLIPLTFLILAWWAREYCRAHNCPDAWKHWAFWKEQLTFRRRTVSERPAG